ncbi:FAD:protein FMN transferase [Massilia terrae]|uniref:FAD:protein FMN transferase n=1 Tax=Massilia terrae TaxID=1811224 RepID=A0ABT2D3P8_9BURK|nr:FAD:protein FMN transferase [Massilia terrae]MCS0660841.1 FAD:protein FMN transferase [Massilia terrae]
MPIYRLPFRAMASQCEVVLAADDVDAANRLAGAAIAEVLRIEATYSRYRSDSIVGRINAAAGQDFVDCDEETQRLLDFADQLYEESGGLFDITSGVLRRAWDFKAARVPSADELAACIACIGWRRVERKGSAIRLPRAGMELDFGGFGKEYAADRAAEALLALGVRHGYVNLAGDLRLCGPRPDGAPWMVGIQHPREPGAVFASMGMRSGALATSGDYERFFDHDGQRYCHILDPRSGRSVTHWRSVSVVAPQAIVAGAVSTIAMLKQEAGLAWLRASGFDFLAIDHTGAVHRAGAAD